MRSVVLGLSLLAALGSGPAPAAGRPAPEAKAVPAPKPDHRSVTVWATAYNSLDEQTDDTPHHGAWGDSLDDATQPGVRVIAVSPDLIERGLGRGKRVRIRGLKGEFVVLDKMPGRWSKRIDIYMRKDEHAARKWGKRRVTLTWKE